MSFCKAKLKRFNDIQSGTPSPADYNVAVGSKTSKCTELQNSSHSENGSSLSHSSVPTFRTPSLLRKLKPGSNTDQKRKPAKLLRCPSNSLEALKEKTVKCNNKDQFIQDLTEQLEEAKQQISSLESNKLRLLDEVSKLEVALGDIESKHNQNSKDVNKKISTITSRMDILKQQHVSLKEKSSHDFSELLRDINTVMGFYKKWQSDYAVLLEKEKDKEIHYLKGYLESSMRDYEQFKKLHKASNIEILKMARDLNEHLENKTKDYIKIFKDVKAEKQRLREQSELEIKRLTEDYKEASMLAEMQMTEKYNECEAMWKLKLEEARQEADAILKECQAIAEYNIIQCEVEKNQALRELAEKNQSLEDLRKENAELASKCQQAKQEFEAELAANNRLIEQLKKDKHMYEVTVFKTHKTVETLKKRLMCSDRDVEQLKAELEAIEESKLEIEEKCNRLMQTTCGLCDDMDKQNQLVMQIAQEKILKIEQELTLKVKKYQEFAEAEISKTKEKLAKVMRHLHEQQMLNEKAQVIISTSEEELERLGQVNQEQEDKLTCLAAAFENLQVELAISQDKEATLAKTNDCLQNENKSIKAQADQVELRHREHNVVTKCKEEDRKLVDFNAYELKQENHVLHEEKKELEGKLFAQARTIEKLRRELCSPAIKSKKLCVQAEDKENIGSPNSSFSHIRSPGTPLRDRN